MARKKVLLSAEDVPASIEVFGRNLPVLVQRIKGDHEGEFVYGEYDMELQRILIDPRHAKDAALIQDTLFHEALHAVFALSGINGLTDHSPVLEETIVRAITSAFARRVTL